MKIRILHRVHFSKLGRVRDNYEKFHTSRKSWVIERNVAEEVSI